MEPSQLGWEPVVKSWINIAPEIWSSDHKLILQALCSWLIPSTTQFVRKQCNVMYYNFGFYISLN